MIERQTLKINNLGVLEIGGISTCELAKEFGTPLYVLDEAYIEQMCSIYKNTLESEYGLGMIYYASKALSCKEIYRIINAQGIGADAVSAGEIYTALKAGFPMKNLCFHGNNKLIPELELATDNGVGYIVLDSFNEADDLDLICKNKGLTQNVLIRVNPGVEAHTHHFIQTANIDSKFGFSISNGQAFEMVKYVLEKKNLKLKGLHCHIGSQIFEEKSFVLAVNKMTDFYKKIKDELNFEFDNLNLGGGFGIWYADGDVKKAVSDYAQYISVIAQTLNADVIEKGLKSRF